MHVFLPYLVGILPILLARSWRARIVALLFGFISVGLGFRHVWSINNSSDVVTGVQGVAPAVFGGLGVAVISVLVTYFVDRKYCMKATSRMKTVRGPFRKQVASDIVRDGLGVELLSYDRVVAEVFRCDADHSLIITTFSNDLPVVAIEELIAVARERLRAFEDGTPLPVCDPKCPTKVE